MQISLLSRGYFMRKVIPTPSSISVIWNYGSILGLAIGVQIVSGIFLAIHYSIEVGFDRIIHIIRDVPWGWIIRLIHANGARVYFLLLFFHFGRRLYFKSYVTQPNRFLPGVTIILLRIATAFIGYVLPWGQIRFWGATVITQIIGAIPYIGTSIVYWLWGRYSVRVVTLSRFFIFHFLLPFVIVAVVIIHLYFLHRKGRTNPLGNLDNQSKIGFHPYFTYKDIVGFFLYGILLLGVRGFASFALMDPENFLDANPMVTPVHIQPEWYFLFAYAILRRIPSKVGGVIALALSVTVYYVFVVSSDKIPSSMRLSHQVKFWALVRAVLVLTFLGAQPVEAPFVQARAVFTVLYFLVCSLFLL